ALPCMLACTGLISSAMKTHIDSVKLQRDSCRLLLEILSQECNLDVERSLDDSVISSLLETLRNYSENEELLSLVCTLLMMISSIEVAAESIRKAGAIPDLLMSIRKFLHNEQICLACCGALWSLVVSENSIDKAVLKNALSASSAVLQEHVQNGAVTEAACSAIWALSLQGCFTENESETTTALLLDALRMNLGRPVLVKNACQALANLLRLSEISAFRFVTDSKGNGIKLIKDAYSFHRDDPEVVESACALINEMVQYDDIALDMVSQKMKEMLSEIKSRFPSS
ncbi:STKL1 protein, partial [Nothoprocta ornata]|nr:STKL1 protein [Nothoprocta pentlandii]NWX96905.1 STKL1 protein [Nothoprocta ornata]